MNVEVAVFGGEEKVAEVRRVLDPLASVPPTIGTNEVAPDATILVYSVPKGGDARMMAQAISLGAMCSRA